MAHLLYVSASLGDLERAKRAIARAKQAGWTITFDWTQEAVFRSGDQDGGIFFTSRERAREVSEEWLRAVLQCDTFLMLASVPASRGRERELGAALAFNLAEVGNRRVIVANREYKRADWAAPSPTAWDGHLEIFDTDEEALVALGNAEPLVLPYPGTGVAELLTATGSRRPEDLVGKTIKVSLQEPRLQGDFAAIEISHAESSPKLQQVVSALLYDAKGRIYLQRREPNKRFPRLWDLPGGKVEEGETPEEALLREIKEELGQELHRHNVGDLVAAYDAQLERPYHLSLYAVRMPYPEKILVTGENHQWVDPLEAVQRLACVPSVYAWYKAIQEYWQRLKRSLLADKWVQQAQKAMAAPEATAWVRVREIHDGLLRQLRPSDPFWQTWRPFFQEVKGRFPLNGELQAVATIAVVEHYDKVRHRSLQESLDYLRLLLSAPHAELPALKNLAGTTLAELAQALFNLEKTG